MQRLPGERKTASPGSAYVRSTQLSNEQSENRSAIENASRHAGNNNIGLETSTNDDDKSASTTRSGKKRKREHSQTPVESAVQQPFACPYWKHDPQTYGRRPRCRGPSFKTISRLKEHLYRTHGQSPHCPRCWKTFKTSKDLRNHQRSADRCEINEAGPIEGFDEDQCKQLKDKKRLPGVRSEEDKWRHIYKILFPNCNKNPDPFYNPLIDEAASKPSPVLATQHITWLLVTPDVPSQLEASICVSVEEALDMKLSITKRRRFMDVLKGHGVMMLWQPLDRAAAAETGERSNSQSLEEWIIGNSDCNPGSAESARFIQPSSSPQPRATPDMSTIPRMHVSNVLSEDSYNSALPMVEAQLPPFDKEGLGKLLRNGASRDWTKDVDDLPGLSFEGHSNSSHVRSFASLGTQIDDGVNTASYAAGDADPLMEDFQAWASAHELWLGM